MPNKLVDPLLAVGQIWRFDSVEYAIVRLSKHLAELRGWSGGKVVRRGPTDLQSLRAIHVLIKKGRAHLTGHFDTTA